MNNEIIGIWKIDSSDQESFKQYGNISMEFTDDGKLVYTIYEDKKKQKIFLVYKIEGDTLITDQPSSPRKEETKFVISNNTLKLLSNDLVTKFIRL